MTHYTVAFMFNRQLTRVALIRKAKPLWQRGLLNGIGGKVEEGEIAIDTNVREFREETGAKTPTTDWKHYARIESLNVKIDFFTCKGNLECLMTQPAEQGKEQEPIVFADLETIYSTQTGLVDNLAWLVALARDHLVDGRPDFALITYPTGDTNQQAAHENEQGRPH